MGRQIVRGSKRFPPGLSVSLRFRSITTFYTVSIAADIQGGSRRLSRYIGSHGIRGSYFQFCVRNLPKHHYVTRSDNIYWVVQTLLFPQTPALLSTMIAWWQISFQSLSTKKSSGNLRLHHWVIVFNYWEHNAQQMKYSIYSCCYKIEWLATSPTNFY